MTKKFKLKPVQQIINKQSGNKTQAILSQVMANNVVKYSTTDVATLIKTAFEDLNYIKTEEDMRKVVTYINQKILKV